MSASTMKPMAFSRGDKTYFVSPVSPFSPGDAEIEELAFADSLKKLAPNDNLMWLRGQFVEADNPNANGQTWTADEISLKALTPMMMPVTVMHDPRTAVGTIADIALKLPAKDGVPRSRLDSTLALWKHRFPEVCEEVSHNYAQGSLMQSMECYSPDYSCLECGRTFQKLPQGAESENWCTHLAESAGFGARILGNVVFTGTGLIFGSRGAKGAFDQAHLEVFQEEVAEAHDRAHHDRGSKTRKRRHTRMENVEIPQNEYAELLKRPEQAALEAEKQRADDAEAAKAEAETKLEAAEAAKTKAEEDKAEADKKLKDADDKANAVKLRDDRFSELGKDFVGKLGEFTSKRLRTDAEKLSDEEWSERLKEISENIGVEVDAGGKQGEAAASTSNGNGKGSGNEEFSREEVARSQVGGGGGSPATGTDQNEAERRSVVAGLRPKREKPTASAAS